MDPWTRVAWGAGALVLSFALAAGPAPRADEPAPEPVQMDEIVVRLPRGELAQAPAAAATVIDADRFAGEAKGVAELLAVSPGVDVQRFGAAGQLATVAIRGVAADGVKVLVDGLPLGAAGGTIDLSTIPRAWVRRIQVVRGPSGAAFGAGALGGAVNIVTRSAPGLSAEASAGSFGTYALSADGGAQVGGLTLLAGATGESTQGNFPYVFDPTPGTRPGDEVRRTAENDASRRGGLLLKLGGPADGYRLDALAQVSGGHRELPGPVYEPTPADWQDDGRALAMVRLARDVGEAVTVSARVHGRGDLLDTHVAALPGLPSQQRGAAGGVQVEAELRAGASRLGALASAEDEVWTGTALAGRRERATLAAALTGDVALGSRVTVGPAVRLEQTGRFGGASANLGARVGLGGDFRLRASVGRTYRIPSFDELYLRQGALEPNPDLRPERGLGADAAVVYDGALGLLSLGGFVEREEDVISYEQISLERFRPLNTPAALLRGVELELATAPLRALWNLSLQSACTLLRSELLAGPPEVVGKDLPRRPREQLFARLSVEPAPLEAHLELRRVRTQFLDRYNLTRLPDATTWAAGASVQLLRAPRLSLHVQLDNLTDRRDVLDGFGNPLPGRTVMVSLRAGTTEKIE